MRDKFKEMGFRVLIAADPQRALDRFRQQPYDALIVDARTTGEDGRVVFEHIMDEAGREAVLLCGRTHPGRGPGRLGPPPPQAA